MLGERDPAIQLSSALAVFMMRNLVSTFAPGHKASATEPKMLATHSAHRAEFEIRECRLMVMASISTRVRVFSMGDCVVSAKQPGLPFYGSSGHAECCPAIFTTPNLHRGFCRSRRAVRARSIELEQDRVRRRKRSFHW